MAVARVFRSGNSQAVRLPKEFRFTSPAVEIFRRGDEVVLREGRPDIGRVVEALEILGSLIELPDDPPPEPLKPW